MRLVHNSLHVLRIAAAIFFLTTSSFCSVAQSIDHWETVVYDSSVWKYFQGTSDPGSNWKEYSFNDAAWQRGRGGFGYQDNDDRTVIGATMSVFIRKKFTITDLDKIEKAWLHVDYDDGFVAYLNGVEVARAYMGDSPVITFNQPSNGLHEALMYQGGKPEGFTIPHNIVNSLLVDGENVIALEVHNENIGSSDLSAAAFLSFGIKDASSEYGPVPSWFTPPTTLSSDLPIIVINTNGQSISDEPGIVADMGVIDNGPGVRNSVNDAYNNYSGKIAIELRGESSQMFPKKSFKVETQDAAGNNLNVPLLGMPPENDWVLYAPYTDKTFLRDVLAYKMGRDLGNYAPRTRFVELIVNDDYQGVYVLIERIKRDKNRVDIATLKPEDISGDDVTGGYILRVDKIDGNDYPQWESRPVPQLPGEPVISFQYFDPKGEELVDQQRNYIRNHIFNFGSALSSTSFSGADGFKKYIDIPSFVNFMIVNEVGKNVDGYIFSTYLYKEKDSKGGKLFMGPLWDFNLCFGNVDYWSNSQFAPGWIWNDAQRMYWFRRMLTDHAFSSALKCRWTELRSTILTNEYFTNAIDSMASVLNEAQERNYQRWNILGTYVWPNQFVGLTYQDEINFLKQWISDRLTWMDANMPGVCDGNVTSIDEELKSITIYPNPSGASFYINVPETASAFVVSVDIVNMLGQEVYHSNVIEENILWNGMTDGKAAAPGIYIAIVKTSGGTTLRTLVKY